MSKDNIEPAIFIADFAGKCIWNINTGQAYPYPVSKEQDGKELREGIDFEIKRMPIVEGKTVPSAKGNYGSSYQPTIHYEDLAIPIEPDDWNLSDKELTKAGMEQTSAFNEPEGLPDQKEGKKQSIAETFKQLRELGIGKYWDNVSCVCDALGRGKCELNCPEHEDNKNKIEPSSKEQEGDAVEFAEWIGDKINPFIRLENGRWIQACGNSTSWSTEQLYKIYKSQNP